MEKGCHRPQVPQGTLCPSPGLPEPLRAGGGEGCPGAAPPAWEGAGRAWVMTEMRRACGSNLRQEQREGDEGLVLAQTHPHPRLARYRRERLRAGCCTRCFQHLRSALLMQSEHKGWAEAPGSALPDSSPAQQPEPQPWIRKSLA